MIGDTPSTEPSGERVPQLVQREMIHAGPLQRFVEGTGAAS